MRVISTHRNLPTNRDIISVVPAVTLAKLYNPKLQDKEKDLSEVAFYHEFKDYRGQQS